MLRVFLTILSLWPAVQPAALWAQDYPLRLGDESLSRAEMDRVLRGAILTFYDNGVSRYYTDGRYSYTFFGDEMESAGGYWEVTEAGLVCVTFITGHARCDRYVKNGDRLVLIDAKGDRFPVRPGP